MSNYEDPQADLTPHQLAEDIFQTMWPIWRDRFTGTAELQSFLAGQRYAYDTPEFSRDRRGIQIRGQETQDQIDHVVAKATERPRSVEAKPKDSVDDPFTAEAMVALITDALADPNKGFDREDYMAIKASREGRRGVVWMDKVDDFGPFGSELFWTFQPNGSVMWDPAYHPHHPLCFAVIRHKRVDFRKANRDYKVDWLRPDHESLIPHTNNWKLGIPLATGYTDRIAREAINDYKVTIREVWIKNDPTVDKSKPPSSTTNVLKASDRYMHCVAPTTDGSIGCGYRSQTQGQMKAQGQIKRSLPESIPAAMHANDQSGCPRCGGPLERIDATEMTQQQLMYARGRRLIITAPFCPGPDGTEHLYDGAWPIPTLRTFPMLVYFASVKPGDNTGGPCDVDRMFDQQMASDQMMTMMVQRIFENRGLKVIPAGAYYNSNGDPFEFRDDDECVAFKDMRKAAGPGWEIQLLNTTNLDPAWNSGYQAVQNALRSFVNKADLAPTPEATRDVPVGTAQQMTQEAEVATEDFIRRCNAERSAWYGVVEDAIRATYTPERIQRLNLDGTDHLIELWGDSLPNFDYVVSETPTFTGIDEQRQKAWDSGMQVAMTLGPEALEPWAQFHNIPRSVLRALQQFFEEKQAQMEQQAAMMGGAPGQGPAAGQGMAPGAPGNAGPMAGGMVPAAAA